MSDAPRPGRPRRGGHDVVFYLPTLGDVLGPATSAPAFGGAETQVWLLARGLAQRGCSVCVVIAAPPDTLPPQIAGVDIVVRAPSRLGSGPSGRIAEIRTLERVLRPLEAGAVVQRTASISTGLVGLMTRTRGRRFVFSSASFADFEFERVATSGWERSLFHLGLRLADLIVVQTDEQAHRCRERFGRRSVVIRSIAEPAAAASGPPEAFLWIGRLVGYKRPGAFLALARALPEARFRMVGAGGGDDPHLVAQIKRDAQSLPNLELFDARPRGELLPMYDTAVAVVNTSEFEGLSNVLLEGWARGIPALALSHDSDRLIERNGLGAFAAGSTERFIEQAAELWKRRGADPELASRCREHVRRAHAPEAIVTEWIDALGLPVGPSVSPKAPQPAPSAVYAQVR